MLFRSLLLFYGWGTDAPVVIRRDITGVDVSVLGPGDEAILLDMHGNLAEGAVENIFLVKDGVIYTPELTACLKRDGFKRVADAVGADHR